MQAVMILLLGIVILAILRMIASRSNTPKDGNGSRGDDNSTTIRCPNCGSPAKRRGDSWECPWCGDSGRIIRH